MSLAATREKPTAAAGIGGLRDIVIQIDEGQAAPGLLAFSAGFARKVGAHLAAVLTQAPPRLPSAVRAEIGDLFFDAWRKQAAEAAKAAAARIAAAGRAEGIEIECRIVEGLPEETLTVHARHADLTIVGQAAGEGAFEQTRAIEALLFGSGRPILLVPAAGSYKADMRHVMCAWNGSREAARAVADAMPLLRAAEHVTILSADPPGTATRYAGADIALHLARHGVKVSSTATYAGDLTVGDAILNRAADLGADLLVMGGYGHSRTREAIFGGATRHVLDHMTLPVLMSH